MSDTLLGYKQMLPGQQMHDATAQRVAVQLLLALEYAHTFGVIHTDIKPSNVFVQLEDESLISASYLPATPADPAAFDLPTKPWLIKSQPIALCCPDFKLTSEVNIVLGDWGVATWSDEHLTELIQPVLLRAPEVLIGASWGPTVNLWNFGAMLLEATRDKRMFSGKTPPDGKYDVPMRLREIEDMFGPFPRLFLDAGDPETIQDCFDEDGKVKHFSNFSRLPLGWYMDGLTDETRILFSAFLRNVMKIDPTKRKNTMQLLSHDWIDIVEFPEPVDDDDSSDW